MQNLVVNTNGIHHSQAEGITSFFMREFPNQTVANGNKIEAVLSELIGTRQTRVGPIPNDACQEALRKVISYYVSTNQAIPVLVPAAPKKPVCDEGIDLAELSAIRTMACLYQRVSSHHEPGLSYTMRMEDVTGWYLEEDTIGAKESMIVYLEQFETLIKLFGYDSFIHPLRESSLTSEAVFSGLASSLECHFLKFIEASDRAALKGLSAEIPCELKNHGWQGSLPTEQLDFYRCRYKKMYPDMDDEASNKLLAKYLSNVLTHRILGISGVNSNWKGHIQLSFVPPVPGTPPSLVSTRVYYRTIPLSVYRCNMPFWRARGYFKIENNTARPALTNWIEAIQLHPCQTTISNGAHRVTLQTNYLLN